MERCKEYYLQLNSLSGKASVWMQSKPFSANHLQRLLGKLASTINFIMQLSYKYSLPSRKSCCKAKQVLEYLLSLDLS